MNSKPEDLRLAQRLHRAGREVGLWSHGTVSPGGLWWDVVFEPVAEASPIATLRQVPRSAILSVCIALEAVAAARTSAEVAS